MASFLPHQKYFGLHAVKDVVCKAAIPSVQKQVSSALTNDKGGNASGSANETDSLTCLLGLLDVWPEQKVCSLDAGLGLPQAKQGHPLLTLASFCH